MFAVPSLCLCDSWIVSKRDASIRNFGFLVSKKRYVLSLDDDCFPAVDSYGRKVNIAAEHALNLLTPSTPYFFNTVYDAYRPCVDFVRGYPYSLRGGLDIIHFVVCLCLLILIVLCQASPQL